MKRIVSALAVFFTAASVFGHRVRADEVDGGQVVRAGLGALRQNLLGANRSAGLGGHDVLVGFGLWLKVFREYVPDVDAGIRSDVGHVHDFITHGTRLIDDGLTLAQLVRLAYPNDRSELTAERILSLALRPFGNQLNDLTSVLDQWAKRSNWVNLGDTCAPVLAP